MIERVEVLPGEGTVIRYGEVVAWAAPSASPALISFLAQSARNLAASARGGRQIADHIAGVLRERDPEPQVAFAVVGPDGGGWASLMHGPVQAWDGNRWLAPTPTPGWLHEPVDPRPAVTVNHAGSHVPALDPDGMWDLEGGVVRGGGFVLVPGGRGRGGEAGAGEMAAASGGMGVATPGAGGTAASGVAGLGAGGTAAAEIAAGGVPGAAAGGVAGAAVGGVAGGAGGAAGAGAAEREHDGPPQATAGEGLQAEPEATGVLEIPDPTSILPASPPTSVIEAVRDEPAPAPAPARPPGSIDLSRPAVGALAAGTRREPLPVGVGPDRPVAGAPVVAGALCERGHLNRPGVAACVRCGASLPQDVAYTVSGTRPGLGCLVVDDGTVWRIDCPYLVGSDPAGDPTVSGGMARPLALRGEGIAASHADIRLKDWDVQVIDRSSPGGTWIYEPGASAWSRLAPYEARTLLPGTHVAFGQRVLTFVTPWVTGGASR